MNFCLGQFKTLRCFNHLDLYLPQKVIIYIFGKSAQQSMQSAPENFNPGAAEPPPKNALAPCNPAIIVTEKLCFKSVNLDKIKHLTVISMPTEMSNFCVKLSFSLGMVDKILQRNPLTQDDFQTLKKIYLHLCILHYTSHFAFYRSK